MSQSRGSIHAITLATISLCIIASLMADARQDKTNGAAGLKVANFDAFRLRSESKYAVDTEKRLQKKQDDANLMLSTWKNNSYMTTVDQKRLGELTVEEKSAGANFPADKATEKKRLEDQSRAYGEEVNRLSATQTLTPAETERIKQLSRAQSDTQVRIQEESQRLQVQFQQENTEATNQLIKTMRESVAKVAKDKGYALVLSNDIAWYADTDLTEATLAVMNKK